MKRTRVAQRFVDTARRMNPKPKPHPDPVDPNAEVAKDVAVSAKVDDASDEVFSLTPRGLTVLKPKRGFETMVANELRRSPGSAKQLVARLLASGDYMKAAPSAALERPLKPVLFILKTWKSGGHVVAEVKLEVV